MELKRIDVLSCAKIAGVLYASMGLLFGGLFSLAALLGAAIGSSNSGAEVPMAGLLFGMGAVVVLPILYGALGAVFAAIGAALYNLAARMIGGIQIELS